MAKELYVGHISENASEEDIMKLFSVMGTVTSVHLIIDPETGEFKRCGYVRMASDVDLQDVAESLDGALLVDRVITVSIARPQIPGMGRSSKPGGARKTVQGGRGAGTSRTPGEKSGQPRGTGSRQSNGSAGNMPERTASGERQNRGGASDGQGRSSGGQTRGGASDGQERSSGGQGRSGASGGQGRNSGGTGFSGGPSRGTGGAGKPPRKGR